LLTARSVPVLCLCAAACSTRPSTPSRAVGADTSAFPPSISRVANESSVNYLLVPGVRAGPVTRCVSESELVRLFGHDDVIRTGVSVSETEEAPGTVLHPHDSTRSLSITWRDTISRRYPDLLQLTGLSSRWHTSDGITLGTSLSAIEQLNGGPFHLAGFGWAYSGAFKDWAGGRLSARYDGHLGFQMDPPFPITTKAAFDSLLGPVLGDTSFSSDLPAMRRLNLRIVALYLSFPDTGCTTANPSQPSHP